MFNPRGVRFLAAIEQAAGLSPDEAERAARATFETLGERLSWGEATDLARGLPDRLRTWLLEVQGDPGPFHADEFLRRVGEREGVDAGAAEEHVRAVFVALARCFSAGEVATLGRRLSNDYRPLLKEALRTRSTAPEATRVPYDEFVRRVERRAGVERFDAERTVSVVLETLAAELASTDVEDFEECLPVEFRAPLERGRARDGGGSLDDVEHAEAVIVTLREALPSLQRAALDRVAAVKPRNEEN